MANRKKTKEKRKLINEVIILLRNTDNIPKDDFTRITIKKYHFNRDKEWNSYQPDNVLRHFRIEYELVKIFNLTKDNTLILKQQTISQLIHLKLMYM